MRIDKLLWFLRFTRTRGAAQALLDEGHVRLGHRRVERHSQRVEPGEVLVLPLGQTVLVIEILTIPDRRGPAREAQSCYRVLDERAANPIAGSKDSQSLGDTTP